MTKRPFTFDVGAHEHISRTEISEDHAAEALLMLAKYLRAYDAVPTNLAEYIANAIEASMVKGKGERAKAFTDELGLTAKNRRPKATWYEVGNAVKRLTVDGMSEDAAMIDVAQELGIDKNTVAKYLAQDKAIMEKMRRDIESDPELSAKYLGKPSGGE